MAKNRERTYITKRQRKLIRAYTKARRDVDGWSWEEILVDLQTAVNILPVNVVQNLRCGDCQQYHGNDRRHRILCHSATNKFQCRFCTAKMKTHRGKSSHETICHGTIPVMTKIKDIAADIPFKYQNYGAPWATDVAPDVLRAHSVSYTHYVNVAYASRSRNTCSDIELKDFKIHKLHDQAFTLRIFEAGEQMIRNRKWFLRRHIENVACSLMPRSGVSFWSKEERDEMIQHLKTIPQLKGLVSDKDLGKMPSIARIEVKAASDLATKRRRVTRLLFNTRPKGNTEKTTKLLAAFKGYKDLVRVPYVPYAVTSQPTPPTSPPPAKKKRKSRPEPAKIPVTEKERKTRTKKWLSTNFKQSIDQNLSRFFTFNQYVRFCKEEGIEPTGPIGLGALIQLEFPKLKTFTEKKIIGGFLVSSELCDLQFSVRKDSLFFKNLENPEEFDSTLYRQMSLPMMTPLDLKKFTSTPQDWVQENFEYKNNNCIPTEYVHSEFMKFVQVDNKRFGRMVKSQFPGTTNKTSSRTYGQKWCYVGLGIKPDSYLNIDIRKKGIQFDVPEWNEDEEENTPLQDRIDELESRLQKTNQQLALRDADISQLETRLKKSTTQASEIAEQLDFVALMAVDEVEEDQNTQLQIKIGQLESKLQKKFELSSDRKTMIEEQKPEKRLKRRTEQVNELMEEKAEPISVVKKEKKKLKQISNGMAKIWIKNNLKKKSHRKGEDEPTVKKSRIYRRLQKYCASIHKRSLNQSRIGKLIIEEFGNLETRRLGSRGGSKYCFVGIVLTNN